MTHSISVSSHVAKYLGKMFITTVEFGILNGKLQVRLYSEYLGSTRQTCILSITTRNTMRSVRKQRIWPLRRKFAALAIFSGILDTVDVRSEGRPLTFRIFVGNQADRIVDGDPLLSKASMEALNNLTFYTE